MHVGAFVPIRLDSERLPGKALREAAGRPILYHLLDRIAAARRIADLKDIVVCTTLEPGNDPLVQAVEAYGASVFRGDKDDLVRRFKDAADAFGFDIIVQVDGDDPLCETEYMDRVADALIGDPTYDSAVTRGLPFGINVKAFTRGALDKVFRHYRSVRNDTGFALYFIKSDLCRCCDVMPSSPDHVLNEARLTLDYEEDLAVFRHIFEALYRPGHVASLAEVVSWLKAHPDVMAINRDLQQAYMDRARQKVDIEYCDTAGAARRIEL